MLFILCYLNETFYEHSQNMNSAIFEAWKQHKIEIEKEMW